MKSGKKINTSFGGLDLMFPPTNAQKAKKGLFPTPKSYFA
jgi:hypothetical protein